VVSHKKKSRIDPAKKKNITNLSDTGIYTLKKMHRPRPTTKKQVCSSFSSSVTKSLKIENNNDSYY
jgi:hypothetical protein